MLFFVLLAAFIVYNVVMHCWYSGAFDAFDAFLYPPTYNDGIPLLHCVAFRGSLHVAMLLFTLHLLDRQVSGKSAVVSLSQNACLFVLSHFCAGDF